MSKRNIFDESELSELNEIRPGEMKHKASSHSTVVTDSGEAPTKELSADCGHPRVGHNDGYCCAVCDLEAVRKRAEDVYQLRTELHFGDRAALYSAIIRLGLALKIANGQLTKSSEASHNNNDTPARVLQHETESEDDLMAEIFQQITCNNAWHSNSDTGPCPDCEMLRPVSPASSLPSELAMEAAKEITERYARIIGVPVQASQVNAIAAIITKHLKSNSGELSESLIQE